MTGALVQEENKSDSGSQFDRIIEKIDKEKYEAMGLLPIPDRNLIRDPWADFDHLKLKAIGITMQGWRNRMVAMVVAAPIQGVSFFAVF